MQLNPQILRKYTHIMRHISTNLELVSRTVCLWRSNSCWVSSICNTLDLSTKHLLGVLNSIRGKQSCIIIVKASVCCVDRYWTVERPRTGGQQRNYSALRRVCRERGTLFEDAEFPPCPRSLYRHKKPSVQPIVWMRPHVSLTVYMSFLT